MADWSELPKELLEEITTHLKSPLDTSRLTAVCSSWRQSLTAHLNFNGRQISINSFPLLFNGVSIYKRSIFLLSPPQIPIFESPENFNPWVIKIEEKSPNLYHLFFPLSYAQIPLPVYFPRSMDMSNTRINDLGCEYFLRYTDELGFNGVFLNLLKEKVAYLAVSNGETYLVLTIHVSGKLALFDNVNNQWHIMSYDADLPFDDVIAFNGDFYAVDCTGTTFLVKVDVVNNVNQVDLVAKAVFGGDKKRLVEIGGELMLVDVYVVFPPLEEFGHRMDDLEDYVVSNSMWFKVFKLDKEEKDWVEVKGLGEYTLFLGLYSSFSVSVADMSSLLKGNCIYFAFPDNFYPSNFNDDDDLFKFHCGGVYSLEDSSISYSNLFWPPPPWLTPSSYEVRWSFSFALLKVDLLM